MNVVTTTELVNEGHNILDRSIGIAYDKNANKTKVIYRSRVGGGDGGENITYLASTELWAPSSAKPIQITKALDRGIAREFLAYVIPDNPTASVDGHNEFLFSVEESVIKKRSRKGPDANWNEHSIVSDIQMNHLEIAAISIDQKLLVYCWDKDNKLVEFTCDVVNADSGWTGPATVPGMPVFKFKDNKNLSVTRTANGICLLFAGQNKQIWWLHRSNDGVWGEAKAIITKDVHVRSPMAIILVPYIKPPSNLEYEFPTKSHEAVRCYPIITTKIPPIPPIATPPICDVEFVVAYVDRDFTAQIQRINEKGEPISGPRRVSRINAQPVGTARPDIPCIFLIPGAYPGTLTVIAISALHGREVLLTLSLVAPRQLVKEAAKSSALLDAAIKEHDARFATFDAFLGKLAAEQAWLAGNVGSVEYVPRAAARDYLGIRYLLAAGEWDAARLAVWRAQVTAIEDYNKMITSCAVSHMRPVKTEAREMVKKEAVFPPFADGRILPE